MILHIIAIGRFYLPDCLYLLVIIKGFLMSLKRVLSSVTGILIMLIIISGCNGGSSSRGSSTPQYGEFISGGSAESNPYFHGSTTLPMYGVPGNLNDNFVKVAICNNVSESMFCDLNKDYVNSATSLFGLSGAESVGNYVQTQAINSGVFAAKLDAINFTAPGAPYLFAGHSTSKEIVSGLVILPLDQNLEPLDESKIKGVVLYYHPTILSKAGIPSGTGNESGDMSATFYTQFMLASIYASAGYIVIAPDYVGQGVDVDPVHPYVLIPQNNAVNGLYMIGALNYYLCESYGFCLESLASGNRNLYISSYSEGAGYALSATQLVSNGTYANLVTDNGLTLKRTVGGSGAYNLTNEMLPFAFANAQNGSTTESNQWNVSPGCLSSVSGGLCSYSYGLAQAMAQYQLSQSKPPLSAYMVNSLVVYDYTDVAYDLVMDHSFAQQSSCIDPLSLTESLFATTTCSQANATSGFPAQSYSVQQLFSTTGLTQSLIASQLFFAAGATGFFVSTYPNTATLVESLNDGVATNSISTFVHQELLNDPGIMALVGAADTYNIRTTSPLSILYIKYDSTITNLNSTTACSAIATTSPGMVTCNEIDNTQLWGDVTFGSLSAPIYRNHGDMEAIMQIAAHNQMATDPH